MSVEVPVPIRVQAPEVDAAVKVEGKDKLKPRHVMYIPGATVSQSDVENTVAPVFAKAYGGRENITMFNSAISTDKRNPKRYEQMADTIMDHMQHGEGIDIVAASLGSTELWRALKIIEKKKPGFLKNQEDKSKLRIVFMAPSGFSSELRERIAYPRRVLALGGAEEKAMETASTFADADEIESLATLLIDRSNVQEGFTMLPARGIRDNKKFLDEDDKAILEEHRAELAGIFTIEDRKEAKEKAGAHLLKRGGALHKNVIKVYRGILPGKTEPEVAVTEEPEEAQMSKLDRSRFLSTTRLGIRALGNHPMLAYQELMDMGYDQIGFRTPWADTVFPLWKIIEFYNGDVAKAQAHTEVIPIGNHNVFHAQPEATIQDLGPFDLFAKE